MKKVTEIRQSSAHDTFIQQSVYLTSTKFFEVLGAIEEIKTEFVI